MESTKHLPLRYKVARSKVRTTPLFDASFVKGSKLFSKSEEDAQARLREVILSGNNSPVGKHHAEKSFPQSTTRRSSRPTDRFHGEEGSFVEDEQTVSKSSSNKEPNTGTQGEEETQANVKEVVLCGRNWKHPAAKGFQRSTPRKSSRPMNRFYGEGSFSEDGHSVSKSSSNKESNTGTQRLTPMFGDQNRSSSLGSASEKKIKEDSLFKRSRFQSELQGLEARSLNVSPQPVPTERISKSPNASILHQNMYQNTLHLAQHNKGLPQTHHRVTSPIQKQIRENYRRSRQATAPTILMINNNAFTANDRQNGNERNQDKSISPNESQMRFLKDVDSTMCWFDTRNEIEQRSKNFPVNLMHALNKIGSDIERLRPVDDERVINFSSVNSPATSLPDMHDNQHHPSLVSLHYHLATSSKRAEQSQSHQKEHVSMEMSRVGSENSSNVSSINNFISAKSYCPTVDKRSAKTRNFLRTSTSWPAFRTNMKWSNLPLGLLKMDLLDPYGRMSADKIINPSDHLLRSVNLEPESPWSSTDIRRCLKEDVIYEEGCEKKRETLKLLTDFKINKRIVQLLPLQNFHEQPTKDKKRELSAVFDLSSQLDVETIVKKAKARKIADAFFSSEKGPNNQDYISFFDEGRIKKEKLDFTDEDMVNETPVFHLTADERNSYSPELVTMLTKTPEIPRGKPAKELSDSIIRTIAALKKQMSGEVSPAKTDVDSANSPPIRSTKTEKPTSYEESARKKGNLKTTVRQASDRKKEKRSSVQHSSSDKLKNSKTTEEHKDSRRNSNSRRNSGSRRNSMKKGKKNSFGNGEKDVIVAFRAKPLRVEPPRIESPRIESPRFEKHESLVSLQPNRLGFDEKSVNNFLKVHGFDVKVANPRNAKPREDLCEDLCEKSQSQIKLAPSKVISKPVLPKEPDLVAEEEIKVTPKKKSRRRESHPTVKAKKHQAPVMMVEKAEIDMDYLRWQHQFLNEIRAPLNLTTNEFTFSYVNQYNNTQALDNPSKEIVERRAVTKSDPPTYLLPELDETLKNFSGLMLEQDSRYRSYTKRIHNNELIKFLEKL